MDYQKDLDGDSIPLEDIPAFLDKEDKERKKKRYLNGLEAFAKGLKKSKSPYVERLLKELRTKYKVGKEDETISTAPGGKD